MGEEVSALEIVIIAGLVAYGLWRLRHVIEKMSR